MINGMILNKVRYCNMPNHNKSHENIHVSQIL
jgi:hypothetical protein